MEFFPGQYPDSSNSMVVRGFYKETLLYMVSPYQNTTFVRFLTKKRLTSRMIKKYHEPQNWILKVGLAVL